MEGEKLDAVYGSDLTRAHATASALYIPRDLAFRAEPLLREICLGHWEQKTWAEIQREDLADGTVVYHTDTAGLLKRYSFTPL